MSIIAGAFSMDRRTPVPASVGIELCRAISRNPADRATVSGDAFCTIVTIHTGAHRQPVVHEDSTGNILAIAGEALIGCDSGDRAITCVEGVYLQEQWLRGDWNCLSRGRGTFCAVQYQPGTATLTLAADKLAIRPLFYTYRAGGEVVLFATALRVLEQVSSVQKVMDLRGIAELVAMNSTLCGRTPYVGIRVLRPGEIVQFSNHRMTRWRYWQIEATPQSPDREEVLLSNWLQTFESAVTARLRHDKAAVAFLSGGLDTRTIVAVLRSRDVSVHSFTFAVEGTQEQQFSRAFAQAAGTVHTEILQRAQVRPHWSELMSEALKTSSAGARTGVERPRVIWSGSGGGELLSGVLVSWGVLDALRKSDMQGAFDQAALAHSWNLPRRLLKAAVYRDLAGLTEAGFSEGMDEFRADDRGRSYEVFQLVRGLRPHFERHFEDIDLHRLELQLPFLDGDMLQQAMRAPLNSRLRHVLYHRWIGKLPSVMCSVPWQTYPDHEPCSVPQWPHAGLAQWDHQHAARMRRLLRMEVGRIGLKLASATTFPDRLLRRSVLVGASIAHMTGQRDCEHVVRAARIICRFYERAGGRVA